MTRYEDLNIQPPVAFEGHGESRQSFLTDFDTGLLRPDYEGRLNSLAMPPQVVA